MIEEIRNPFPPAIPIHGSLPLAKKGVWSSDLSQLGTQDRPARSVSNGLQREVRIRLRPAFQHWHPQRLSRKVPNVSKDHSRLYNGVDPTTYNSFTSNGFLLAIGMGGPAIFKNQFQKNTSSWLTKRTIELGYLIRQRRIM